ncbi:MAG: methylornithine synthase PylB [Methanomassiliicoccus sp.]|nr:methylornithine synthase PylB [Methanomassiliicoccus sp.]
MEQSTVDGLLAKAWDQEHLTHDDIVNLLSVRNERDISMLFETAREIKERNFDNKVFLYGFVYFSTYCRNNCSFCFYRQSNDDSVRYRKTKEEIISLAVALEDAGVHLIDLTMGEDPRYHAGSKQALLDVIQGVSDEVRTPIMASPGVIPKDLFNDMRNSGVDWFACYQETHNQALFTRLRPDQDYYERYMQKIWARRSGLLTEEGIMVGVGESIDDRATSIEVMLQEGVQQVRAMTFVPQKNTPMETVPTTTYLDELVTMAVMRLVHQDKLIPASLDIQGVSGLKPRLDAGANVITSIIPPEKGLAGVAQHVLEIDTGERSPGSMGRALGNLDVDIAPLADYNRLIGEWKNSIVPQVIA